MARMLLLAGIGAVVGLLVFLVLFSISMPRDDPDRLAIWVVFSLMGALPVALIGLVLGAVSVVRQELDEIRREIMRMQRIDELLDKEQPSTHFKTGPPPQ